MRIRLLISPLVKSAYFYDYKTVVNAEFSAFFPDCPVNIFSANGLDWLETEIEKPDYRVLARLSFTQGIFRLLPTSLEVLSCDPHLSLTNEFVRGNKYQGKTNETVTQLAINLALLHNKSLTKKELTLLDPMAGGGTTLLWSLRYGIETVGLDIDPRAIEILRRHLQTYTKHEKLKHTRSEGHVGRSNQKGFGKFIQYNIDGKKLKLVSGDSSHSPQLLNRQKFHLLVTDIPYGIQHKSPDGNRNPIDTINRCVSSWYESLKPGGSASIVFNNYQPKRAILIRTFEQAGFIQQEFTSPHRMSESIVRDIAVFNRPIVRI